MDDSTQVQDGGSMKKEQSEAEFLESQAGKLERFVDFSWPRPAVFPNLKPSTARVTLRMPVWLLAELKREADRRDVPYQSLLKVILADWLRQQSAA
jgi:predicted DNA binding CopG/RHH family protein